MAKLPGIVQQPLGEYALGNIATPNAMAPARSMMKAMDVVSDLVTVSKIDEATGSAAQELTELRATLVNNNTLDPAWVGDDAIAELQMVVTDGVGGRKEISKPRIFTHEVAAEIWDKRSAEIIDNYAGKISNAQARAKFKGEMMERYLAPGTQAIISSTAIRSRAYGQAQAQRTVEQVLSSDLNPVLKESQAKEVIARQLILGADPLWAENQVAELGPQIDQIEAHKSILGAQEVDSIDQIEEDMWSGGNRMTAAQRRTMSTEMDNKRNEFKRMKVQEQTEQAEQMFGQLPGVGGNLSRQMVADAVTSDRITWEAAWTLYNALDGDGPAKATSPWTLSKYRGEIAKLQYTGNNMGVQMKSKLLSLMVTRASVGLNPNGTPSGQPSTITGEDAFKLNKDIALAVKAATENVEYKKALGQVLAWTRSKLDLEGQITTGLGGNQHQVEAAVAFKQALDGYMDQYGFDAKPTDFFLANKDAYDPRNFSSGINGRFYDTVPQAQGFMTVGDDEDDEDTFFFSKAQQGDFLLWLADNESTIGSIRTRQIMALFDQYYGGKGIAPDNGRMMLESEDPLYHQFEEMMNDYE